MKSYKSCVACIVSTGGIKVQKLPTGGVDIKDKLYKFKWQWKWEDSDFKNSFLDFMDAEFLQRYKFMAFVKQFDQQSFLSQDTFFKKSN